MGSKEVEDLIEASSGVHFSGFHLKNNDPSTLIVEQPTTSAAENIKQPFVIGSANVLFSSSITQILGFHSFVIFWCSRIDFSICFDVSLGI